MHDSENIAASAPDEDPVMIGPGASVTLYFSLALADGAIIDSNYDKSPASFRVGDGSLLPGFEQALAGMSAGEKLRVQLPAEQAFGERNEENIQRLPRQRFAALLANTTDPVEPGTVLAFNDGGGHEIPGVVMSLDGETLVVDFNHPLAGRDIQFSADIVSVIPADAQQVVIR